MSDQNRSRSVFCALVCPSAHIGLFIRQPDKQMPMWKIAAGDVEPGETIYAALLRETKEETGFAIPHRKEGDVLIIGNDENQLVSFGTKEVAGRKGGIHEKHYFGVMVKDEREIIALDGQILKEDMTETIETKVFDLNAIASSRDFLYGQREYLLQVIAYAQKIRNGD